MGVAWNAATAMRPALSSTVKAALCDRRRATTSAAERRPHQRRRWAKLRAPRAEKREVAGEDAEAAPSPSSPPLLYCTPHRRCCVRKFCSDAASDEANGRHEKGDRDDEEEDVAAISPEGEGDSEEREGAGVRWREQRTVDNCWKTSLPHGGWRTATVGPGPSEEELEAVTPPRGDGEGEGSSEEAGGRSSSEQHYSTVYNSCGGRYPTKLT